MTLWQFVRWEDGSTTPTRTLTVTSDITIKATYEAVLRRVTYESTPIAVDAIIDATPVPPGTVLEIADGTTITISVPESIEG